MPNAIINKVAKDTSLSKDKVEEYWNKAKEIALKDKNLKDGTPKFYKYTMGVFKNMLGKKNQEKLQWESKLTTSGVLLMLLEDDPAALSDGGSISSLGTIPNTVVGIKTTKKLKAKKKTSNVHNEHEYTVVNRYKVPQGGFKE